MATCTDSAQRTIKRGDSDIFTVYFKDSTETAIDITGWEVRYTVRADYAPTSTTSDADAAISALATIATGTDGAATFNITPSQTQIDPKKYRYDIQYKDATGITQSLETSVLVVEADVTRDE